MRASQRRAVPVARLELISRELADLPPGARILSVGEGYGVQIASFAQTFTRLVFYAVDIDAEYVEQTDRLARERRLTNLHAVRADAAALPFARSAFALTYGRSVLHLLPDPRGHLIEAARVTSGTVIHLAIANWPWYGPLRTVQAATLWLRGKRYAASVVFRDARYAAAKLMATKRGARWYVEFCESTGAFDEVRLVGHDLLWWYVDRHVPAVGLIGAGFGLRCSPSRGSNGYKMRGTGTGTTKRPP